MTEGGLAGQPAARDEGASGVRPSSTYRCFMFADLRGYTSFIERAGNAAGVALLDDYLAMLRSVVAEYEGAEIKVEGDGFHAVFRSASSAVMCGLSIVESAAAATREAPDRPMPVGVGIHAGEALETADGFIGSAVNLASRVCAAAEAGEVLVTATVRGITHASIPVAFVSRGRRRLKGIDERVELFSALPADSGVAQQRGRRSNPWLVVTVGVAVLALGVAGALTLPGLTTPAQTPSPPPPTPRSLEIGPLQLGTYVADQFHPTFSFVIDDPGWSVYRVYPDAMGLHYDASPVGRLDIGRIPLLYGNPCTGDGDEVATGTSIEDLVNALESVPYLQLSEVKAAEISRTYAISVDITVDPGAQAACGGFGTEGIAVFRVAEDVWNAVPGEIFRLRAVAIDGTVVAFLSSAESPADSTVPATEQFFARAERVIQSITF
jgi:class 3 adenylate cyclase